MRINKTRALLQGLKCVAIAADYDVPIQQVLVLLAVAHDPGLSLQDIAKVTGLGAGSSSRNAAAIGLIHRHGKPGKGWIDYTEAPTERRRHVYQLTPKGRKVLDKMMNTIYPDLKDTKEA